MDVIKRFGLIVCILMVLMAYLKQAIPRGRTLALMRTVISIFILISVIDGVRNLDFGDLMSLFDQPYISSHQDAENEIATGLCDEFNGFLSDQKIDATVKSIMVNEDAQIIELRISGPDGAMAKELLAARYYIEKQNIEVTNE